MTRRSFQRAVGLFTFLVLVWNPTGTKAAFGQFFDDFTDGVLDPVKWIVFKNIGPLVSAEGLTLQGGESEGDMEEVQTVEQFRYGTLVTTIRSFDGREGTDTSCGLETWTGNNGRCHYGITLKASGHLGILEPNPDANGNCFVDPPNQAFIEIPNWKEILAGRTVSMNLSWSKDKVVLHVWDSDNVMNSREITYLQPDTPGPNKPAIPSVPLKIRLNADAQEKFTSEYVLFTE